MSKLIFLVLMFVSIGAFAQRRYPITTIFKGDTVVMMTTAQSQQINSLIDSLTQKTKKLELDCATKELIIVDKQILDLKKDSILKQKNLEYDSLKSQVDSMKLKFDNYEKLDSFKNEILNLAWIGSIIYQRDDGTYYYIMLGSYKWTIWGNDKIVMRPIRDVSKWKTFKLDGLPQPDNLSLHLWPHKYSGDKLKIQRK